MVPQAKKAKWKGGYPASFCFAFFRAQIRIAFICNSWLLLPVTDPQLCATHADHTLTGDSNLHSISQRLGSLKCAFSSLKSFTHW